MDRISELSLEERERALHQIVGRYPSHLLIQLVSKVMSEQEHPKGSSARQFLLANGNLPPFVAAGVADLAMRVSNPHRGSSITWTDFGRLAAMTKDYLLLDPVTFDSEVNQTFLGSHPILLMLRTFAAQVPFNVSTYARPVRSLLLFLDAAKSVAGEAGLSHFNFEQEFQNLFGITLEEFTTVAFVAWTAASATPQGFTGEYFAKAKRQGMKLPGDDVVLAVLTHLSSDRVRMQEIHKQLRQPDRRFRMYDPNPLLTYPILRPFKSERLSLTDSCAFIAPLPDLITYKATTGLYYELKRARGKDFTRWFGHPFEAYIGELLRHSVPNGSLWSERALREFYPTSLGKVPDWVVLDGSTCIPVECKATEFYRDVVTKSDEEDILDNLEQTRKGLRQLYEFTQAILNKAPGLEKFHHCSRVRPLLVALEPLYLMNGGLGRNFIDEQLAAEGIPKFFWQILDMQSIEVLQPHLKGGFGFGRALDMIGESDPDHIIGKIAQSTGLTFKDSFMNKKFDELVARLDPKQR